MTKLSGWLCYYIVTLIVRGISGQFYIIVHFVTLTGCVDFYTSMNIRYRGICEINPESQKIEFLNIQV